MGMPQIDATVEGWLYVIGSNRLGLQNSRKRFFVLQDHHLQSYKSIPTSAHQEPAKRTVLDSYVRVTDNGRVSIHGKTFFIFTLYNTSNHSDRLKLGARSSEEAARWIHSFQEATLKVVCHSRFSYDLRLNGSRRVHHSDSIDWSRCSFTQSDPTTSDVVALSPWIIFGCQNGLRMFKETKDRDFHGKLWDDHPAIMAVGVVDGTPEAIYRTVMSLGSSRSQWDFSFYRGNVVEHLDGHTDIIHKQLYSYWLPWRMRPRDLLLRRYWRMDDDGTYVILYHSVYHKKCRPQSGYIRACLKSGGYVITPVKNGKQSVVKHILAIDWKYWKAYLMPSSARSITICMLERVAALREYFKAKAGKGSLGYSSGDFACLQGAQNMIECLEEKDVDKTPSGPGSLLAMNDISEEFFDVPDQSNCEPPEENCLSYCNPDSYLQDARQKLPTATTLVKKLQEFSVPKKGYIDLEEMTGEGAPPCCYGSTLDKDSACSVPSTWMTTDP